MERPRCRAVKLSIPPSTKRQRSNVMGMALFAREGGLNSALPALSRPLRSPDSKVIAQPTPSKPTPAEPMPRTRNLASCLRAALEQYAPTPKVRPARSFLVDSSRVTLDLYRDRSAIGISRSLQIHLCSRTSRGPFRKRTIAHAKTGADGELSPRCAKTYRLLNGLMC
jgi:hypothetical protein